MKNSSGLSSSLSDHQLYENNRNLINSYQKNRRAFAPQSHRQNPREFDAENINHDSDLNEDYEQILHAQQDLIDRSTLFSLPFDKERGYRGTELRILDFHRPHMRAFHVSWICFFTSFFVQFSQSPLLPEIQKSLNLEKADIWFTNLWMMVGGIPMRFLLGPLCDKYGARITLVTVLGLAAIPCALTGLVAVDLTSLTIVRFLIGATDSFVPSQYWITCHFVREVGGTAMAMAGGLGASGAGVTQLLTGSLVFGLIHDYLGNDLSWRLALLFPAGLAVLIAWFTYYHSDDCPLGNYNEVKKAGLMLERSAVDSFRSGAYNLNSWILCLQYAGSCGVDLTMCNATALYYHYQFGQTIAASGALAFLYGISAVFARGLGGWLSDSVSASFSLQGRLYVQLICMMVQGLLNIWFSRIDDFFLSLFVMVIWSILIQMSMGTCFGIVPYVDGPNTGSVAGIVGAGGNVGATFLAWIFMFADYNQAMEYMGYMTILTSLLTPFVVIKGYRGILSGKEESADSIHRIQHSPLLVPGKLGHSPHLKGFKR